MINLDIRTLLAGVLLGAAVMLSMGSGAGAADADRFGIAVANQGMALVSASNGDLFVVNPETGMAVQVLNAEPTAKPADMRDRKGKNFNLNAVNRAHTTSQ